MVKLSSQTIIITTTLVLAVSLFLSFANTRTLDFYDDSLSVGPTLTAEESKPYPSNCNTIDYVMTEKKVTGWPFAARVSADDICGVYFPQDSQVYIGSIIANFLCVGLPFFGFVLITLKKKENIE